MRQLPLVLLFSLLVASTNQRVFCAVTPTPTQDRTGVPLSRIRMNTRLVIASYSYSRENVRILLESGANPNGNSALLCAVMRDPTDRDKTDVIRQLLSFGAHINKPSELPGSPFGQMTPLMAAATMFDRASIMQLIQAKANIGYKNNKGFSALDCAYAGFDSEVKQEIIALLQPPTPRVLSPKKAKTSWFSCVKNI